MPGIRRRRIERRSHDFHAQKQHPNAHSSMRVCPRPIAGDECAPVSHVTLLPQPPSPTRPGFILRLINFSRINVVALGSGKDRPQHVQPEFLGVLREHFYARFRPPNAPQTGLVISDLFTSGIEADFFPRHNCLAGQLIQQETPCELGKKVLNVVYLEER